LKYPEPNGENTPPYSKVYGRKGNSLVGGGDQQGKISSFAGKTH